MDGNRNERLGTRSTCMDEVQATDFRFTCMSVCRSVFGHTSVLLQLLGMGLIQGWATIRTPNKYFDF